MSDNKGVYIPFRWLLMQGVDYWSFRYYQERNAVPYSLLTTLKNEIQQAKAAIDHYDELLRIHNMQEVK